MFEFITFIRDSIFDIHSLLDSVYFDVFDFAGVHFNVSLADLLIGFICMGLIISVFWKGART